MRKRINFSSKKRDHVQLVLVVGLSASSNFKSLSVTWHYLTPSSCVGGQTISLRMPHADSFLAFVFTRKSFESYFVAGHAYSLQTLKARGHE
ncbi:hypothetical protein ACE6H2_003318 [Prunus campanulata]